MAEIQTEKRKGRHTTKIDFTPMVDLGFLLITFFMLTTVLTKSHVLTVNMPVEGPKTPLPPENALTVILSEENTVYYYAGDEFDKMQVTGFSKDGIRSILMEHRSRVMELNAGKKEPNKLMVMIKSDNDATYGNLVDMIDEMQITGVAKYAIVNLDPMEEEQMAVLKQ